MVLVHISSGRGPVECELAVGLYLDLLLTRNPDARVIKEQRGKTVNAEGKRLTAYSSVLLEFPAGREVKEGTVQWICQSPVRKTHRRKNWFIEVSRVTREGLPPELDDAGLDPARPDKSRIRVETFRSPGKGGQNVNKVETGVRVTHLPTGLVASSVTARTQLANRKLALERLRAMITSRNAKRESQLQEAEWRTHDQLERGNAFAVFKDLDFTPVENA